jgi:phosphopantothenate-cysteine ligase
MYDTNSQVPKLLGLLAGSWAPGAMVVSFKLETDEQILVDKVCAVTAQSQRHPVIMNSTMAYRVTPHPPSHSGLDTGTVEGHHSGRANNGDVCGSGSAGSSSDCD